MLLQLLRDLTRKFYINCLVETVDKILKRSEKQIFFTALFIHCKICPVDSCHNGRAIPAPYNSGYLEGSTPATYLNTTTATHDYSYPVSMTLATQSYFI